MKKPVQSPTKKNSNGNGHKPPKAIKRLSDLRPQAVNINKGTVHGLAALDNSIRRDGYSAPMVAAADGEIFAGSKRLEKSADIFGLDVEPIIVESDGTRPIVHVRTDIKTADDPRAKRLGAADNIIAAMDWNPDAALLAALAAEDEAVMQLAKQEDKSLKALADAQGDGEDDGGAEFVRNETPSRVKAGDVWELGRHKIACCDCTDIETVKGIIGDAKPRMIFSDPPYGISIVDVKGFVGGGTAYNIPFGGRKKKRQGTVGGVSRLEVKVRRLAPSEPSAWLQSACMRPSRVTTHPTRREKHLEFLRRLRRKPLASGGARIIMRMRCRRPLVGLYGISAGSTRIILPTLSWRGVRVNQPCASSGICGMD